jgi:hypothetical protein
MFRVTALFLVIVTILMILGNGNSFGKVKDVSPRQLSDNELVAVKGLLVSNRWCWKYGSSSECITDWPNISLGCGYWPHLQPDSSPCYYTVNPVGVNPPCHHDICDYANDPSKSCYLSTGWCDEYVIGHCVSSGTVYGGATSTCTVDPFYPAEGDRTSGSRYYCDVNGSSVKP